MENLYAMTHQKAKQLLYQLMKKKDIPLLEYNFHYFFDHFVAENKILVLPHHFTNRKIEGLTIIDKMGISISYEQDNPITKQNFTICHELGHFLLNHEGGYLAESVDDRDNSIEREANIFSAFILMPDIVLLSKIYYAYHSFLEVQQSLEVSKEALTYRLVDLLRDYQLGKENEIRQVVEEYVQGQNASIYQCFHKIKNQIGDEYNQYQPSTIDLVIQKIKKNGFLTNLEVPDLMNQELWPEITGRVKYAKVWLIYNKGKSIAYAWDQNIFTDNQARKKAEFQLLIM